MNAGSLILEESACRLDDANVGVLSVEVVRTDLDMKREAHEPALEAGARPGARSVTVNSDVPNLERTS